MASLALCVISPTAKEAKRVIDEYGKFFDKVFVQINGEQPPKNKANVYYSYYKWNDNFAAARNALLQQVDTDYWAWVDTDDIIEEPAKFRELVTTAIANQLDAVMLPYEYQRNPWGDLEAYQWRERLLRTGYPWKWKGIIHETPVAPESGMRVATNDEITIKHQYKDPEAIMRSAERNHALLLKESKKKNLDPRTLYYFANSCFFFKDFEQAIETMHRYIKLSGWEEEKYRGWLTIAKAYLQLKDFQEVVIASMAALSIEPKYPYAYLLMAQAYYGQEDYEKVIEWLRVGLAKPIPEDMGMQSPSDMIIGMLTGAMSEMALGHTKEAFDLLQLALAKSPDNPYLKDARPLIEFSYLETLASEKINWLADFYAKYGGDPDTLLKTLPFSLFADHRLNVARTKYLKPTTWPKKSMVFFCPQGVGTWGADTLDKGMGGSEEAVVYLSRALSRLGWEVVIFNERDKEYHDISETPPAAGLAEDAYHVTYKPWQLLNPTDQFDVFVAWRNPHLFKEIDIKARIKAVDMHDAIPFEDDKFDKVFFKSRYHASLADIPPEKKVVLHNGVVKEQFHEVN